MNLRNTSILEHQQYIESGAEMFCELIGGSKLYGLDTPDSDVDYRGVYVVNNPAHRVGLKSLDSIVQTGDVDSCYYEFRRFLDLLQKTNTQSLDMLCAPEDAYTVINMKHAAVFYAMRGNYKKLIDTDKLASSLKGYVFSEMRLATGERTGQLGSKRKQQLEQHGFSPKNFVQILRLCYTGKVFFETSKWIVNHTQTDELFMTGLRHIKMNPQEYTREDLTLMVEQAYADLLTAIENTTISYKFDVDFAASLYLSLF